MEQIFIKQDVQNALNKNENGDTIDKKISISILSSDYSCLDKEIIRIDSGNYLHIDIMDGHFVNNITIGPAVVQSIRKKSNLIFDVHLMIDNPEKFISEFAKVGADIITFHITATKTPLELINSIRSLGCKVGIAINPDDSVDLIVNYLLFIDQVIIMGVYAGFGGQKFIPSTLLKIKKLRDLGYEKDIEIDGGINQETIIECNNAGANIFVSGSFIFNSQNPKETIELLRKSIQ